jgi:hypothetical protein
MTYPKPEKPEKYGHPSTYPVADDEFVSDAFYRKPLFFIPCIVGIIVTVLVAIVLTASSRKPAVVLPTYDQEVLTFPAGTTVGRKPLCIDSNLVEKFDRITEANSFSVYRCGLMKSVGFHQKFSKT